MYEMQIRIQERDELTNKTFYKWVSVKPTGGSPYQYETKLDALKMLNICYGEVLPENKRIIEIP
jgi:hypothetical protein